MPTMAAASSRDAAPASDDATRHVGGSVALFGARLLSLGLDFAAHVLIVRNLAKDDFGSYAYALAIVILLANACHLGLPEAVARHVPLYRHLRRPGAALGSVAFAVVAVFTLCVGLSLAVVLLPGVVAAVVADDQAAHVLRYVIWFVPIEATNQVFQALFASLGKTRVILLRQNLLVPLLRLAVAAALLVGSASVEQLAVGYVMASAVGLLIYLGMTPAVLAELAPTRAKLEYPVRAMVSFAVPVLVSSLFYLVIVSAGTVALGVLAGPADVASFQAVAPPARLNYLALTIFMVLYVPAVARMLAEGDSAGLGRAHQQTTAWMVVLTLPILALTTIFASTVVPALFDGRYATSVLVLRLLALGYAAQLVLGINDAVLRASGRLRAAVVIDVASLMVGVSAIVVLTSSDGAPGTAAAILLASVFRTITFACVVRRAVDVPLFGPVTRRAYTGAAVVMAVLAGLELASRPGLAGAAVLAAVGGAALIAWCRVALDLRGLRGAA